LKPPKLLALRFPFGVKIFADIELTICSDKCFNNAQFLRDIVAQRQTAPPVANGARGGNGGNAIRTRGTANGTPGANGLAKIGAGEGIRTLDPNLGKVVLYP
jgi:hypothetical protein